MRHTWMILFYSLINFLTRENLNNMQVEYILEQYLVGWSAQGARLMSTGPPMWLTVR